MTVTDRKKRPGDVRVSVACESTVNNKRNGVRNRQFYATPNSCCCRTKNFEDDYCLMTLPTPDDSTASWLDADDSYQVADFLDEATRILHDEGDFSDACHDRLRFEYEQWKRIPHLRIIGKRIDGSCGNAVEEYHHLTTNDQVVTDGQTDVDNRKLDLLRDRVIKIMTEILWQRVLDKTIVKSANQKQLVSRRRSSDQIESALVVSSMLPANRPRPIAIKSHPHVLETVNRSARPAYRGQSNTKYIKKPWSKNSANFLPPIEIHHKQVADKTKRWFSAIGTPGRNHTLPRPVTSVTTHVNAGRINVCFDISVDGKSCIKSLKKKDTTRSRNNNIKL